MFKKRIITVSLVLLGGIEPMSLSLGMGLGGGIGIIAVILIFKK